MPVRPHRLIPGVEPPLPELAVNGYKLAAMPKRLGPPGTNLSQPAKLSWRVPQEQGRQAFIGAIEEDGVRILETYFDDDRGEVYAFIDRTGDYLLLIAENGDQNQPAQIPQTYVLEQNYPNPFNPRTTIRFAVPTAQTVSIMIYNIKGQLIRTLLNEQPMEAGWHRIVWDGRDDTGNSVASGVYLYRLKTADFEQVKKMTLIQ